MSSNAPQASRRPSRFRLAFLNVWNGLAMAAAAGLAVATKSPLPLIVGGALEGVWLTLASSPVISRKLFGATYDAAEAAELRARRDAEIGRLPQAEQARVRRLEERREAILTAASQNRSFAGGLLETEIDKVDDLVEAFIELAGAQARWQTHLARIDFDDLESELRRAEADAAQALDDERRRTARKNLAVLMQRRDGLADLREKLANARAELDLIENSFKLLGDQVMVMTSPHDIRGQLDDLLVGVEAVREMTRDDDALLEARAARTAQAEVRKETTHG